MYEDLNMKTFKRNHKISAGIFPTRVSPYVCSVGRYKHFNEVFVKLPHIPQRQW